MGQTIGSGKVSVTGNVTSVVGLPLQIHTLAGQRTGGTGYTDWGTVPAGKTWYIVGAMMNINGAGAAYIYNRSNTEKITYADSSTGINVASAVHFNGFALVATQNQIIAGYTAGGGTLTGAIYYYEV